MRPNEPEANVRKITPGLSKLVVIFVAAVLMQSAAVIQAQVKETDWTLLKADIQKAQYIALDASGNVYTSERYGYYVYLIDPVGKVSKLTPPHNGDGTGPMVMGAVTLPDGNLYVGEYSGVVDVRSPQGFWDTLPDKFNYLYGIVTDVEGNLYISTDTGRSLKKRNTQGQWSDILVPSDFRIDVFAVGNDGRIYAVSTDGKLWIRDTSGKWVLPDSDLKRTNNQIAIDANNNVYIITDYRVQIRSDSGVWSTLNLPDPKITSGYGMNAWGIALNSRGEIYLAATDGKTFNLYRYTPASPVPKLISLSGTSAKPGQIIFITGTDFDPTLSQVQLNDTVVPALISSKTQAMFQVPLGKSASYDVSVRNGLGVSNSLTLGVPSADPELTSLPLPGSNSSSVKGDVNGDSAVDIRDVVLLLRKIVGLDP